MFRRTPLSAHLASMLAGALLVAGGALAEVRAADVAGNPYFIIRVVDAQTDRGVPLVELETVNHLTHISDSAGIIAFNEPGLMEREVYFHVRSHGYDYPKDGFGNRGVKLVPRAGTRATVKVTRQNVAERIYRITGAGIYRDSVLAGLPVPLAKPVLNAEVLGQDSVIATPYRGKLYWFWGDTERASYPLGNFAVAGATSELPGRGGLAPVAGVDFTYFVNETGFAKTMCPDFGQGLHWIEALMAVPDEHGVERLVARVTSQTGLVAPYAWHFAVFNDEKQIFESKSRWQNPDTHDSPHPFRARVDGVDYLYLYPNLRVKADLTSVADPQNFEAFTCIAGDGKLAQLPVAIARDPAGAPHYRWLRGADRLHDERLRHLIAGGQLKPEESWLALRDFVSGSPFNAGRGSVFWNEYRRRWVMLAADRPGEIWFSEADTPTGPWGYGRRVVSHDDYNFYNPTQPPFFDEDGGRTIYFEGTYTASFSNAKSKTARYDYNQIMYRLRLEDARLSLPAAVYQVTTPSGPRLMQRDEVAAAGAWERIDSVAFFAVPPAPAPRGLVPIYADRSGRLVTAAATPPLFLALPLAQPAGHGIAGRWLWRFTSADEGSTEFLIDVDEHDGDVKISDDAHSLTGQGKFTENRLTLDVLADGQSHRVTARFVDGALSGEWARDDGKKSGQWTDRWQDSTPPEFHSPAIVPLYEYRHPTDGRVTYSIDPAASFDGFVRTGPPLCRVWRSPTSAVLFDRRPLTAAK